MYEVELTATSCSLLMASTAAPAATGAPAAPTRWVAAVDVDAGMPLLTVRAAGCVTVPPAVQIGLLGSIHRAGLAAGIRLRTLHDSGGSTLTFSAESGGVVCGSLRGSGSSLAGLLLAGHNADSSSGDKAAHDSAAAHRDDSASAVVAVASLLLGSGVWGRLAREPQQLRAARARLPKHAAAFRAAIAISDSVDLPVAVGAFPSLSHVVSLSAARAAASHAAIISGTRVIAATASWAALPLGTRRALCAIFATESCMAGGRAVGGDTGTAVARRASAQGEPQPLCSRMLLMMPCATPFAENSATADESGSNSGDLHQHHGARGAVSVEPPCVAVDGVALPISLDVAAPTQSNAALVVGVGVSATSSLRISLLRPRGSMPRGGLPHVPDIAAPRAADPALHATQERAVSTPAAATLAAAACVAAVSDALADVAVPDATASARSSVPADDVRPAQRACSGRLLRELLAADAACARVADEALRTSAVNSDSVGGGASAWAARAAAALVAAHTATTAVMDTTVFTDDDVAAHLMQC